MEKRLRTVVLFLFFSIILFPLFPFGSGVSQENLVRFSLWAQTEVYPGFFKSDVSEKEKSLNIVREEDEWYSVPVRKIREIAPFLVEGMVYGWRFSYTPYDRARGVEEFFEFEPVNRLSEEELSRIHYKKPWAEGDRLSAWIEFQRTAFQSHRFRAWESVLHPRIKGVGFAHLSKGFDGIREASEEALKNAVREYERTILKTKPKEVSGIVLIREPPLIGIDAGRYRITLDFFMETDRILEYRTF